MWRLAIWMMPQDAALNKASYSIVEAAESDWYLRLNMLWIIEDKCAYFCIEAHQELLCDVSYEEKNNKKN